MNKFRMKSFMQEACHPGLHHFVPKRHRSCHRLCQNDLSDSLPPRVG
jgi:hypothetical protein